MEKQSNQILVRRRAGWLLFSMSAMMTVPLVSIMLHKPDFWSELFGINETIFRIPLSWILASGITLGYVIYTMRVVPMVRNNLWKLSWLKFIGIFAALISGIFEELFFRARLMDWLNNNSINVLWQIFASAFVFGVAHGLWGLFSRDKRIIIPTILSTFVLGGLLAITYIVGERNLLPCILSHLTINLIIEPWLILSAITGSDGEKTSD